MESQIDYKYLNGKIYKLVCKKEDLIYIGSTINTLKERLWEHCCKQSKCISKRIIDNGDYEIILLELYPCMCKRELEQREQEWMEQFDCINLQRSYKTIEDERERGRLKYQKYKQKILLRQSEYQKKNEKKLKQKIQCECGGKYTYCSKSRHFKTKKHKDYISKNNI
jgi:hypothetical protein